ncbi:hypothetical protein Sxan_25500 [Streptomyces xanthophaeus]|uniref:Uncharacterized protein n=1 Tax=Streptomyces xanthophaeus TaxID=67385 RepID=A0A919GV64_9ACTN|nr:hypothetical protein Sxan_25500 [Streptomyces xanthophaeus]
MGGQTRPHQSGVHLTGGLQQHVGRPEFDDDGCGSDGWHRPIIPSRAARTRRADRPWIPRTAGLAQGWAPRLGTGARHHRAARRGGGPAGRYTRGWGRVCMNMRRNAYSSYV